MLGLGEHLGAVTPALVVEAERQAAVVLLEAVERKNREPVTPPSAYLSAGPPPAYARGQAAVGGAEPWPQVPPVPHPGILRGVGAVAGL